MTDTPIVTFRPSQSRILPDAYFLIDGDTRMYAIVCVDHDGMQFVLVDELCGNEDIKLPRGFETGREIRRLVQQAAVGSKAAQDRLAAYAVEGIMIARGLREGAREGGMNVAIEVLSCGEWVRSRFGLSSPSCAAAMLSNLRERGIRVRTVPAR